MFKGFSTQEYLDEFCKRDLAGWTAFQAEVFAVGDTANGNMVVKHMLGTLAGLSEKMRDLTKTWYKNVMGLRSNREARDFRVRERERTRRKR